MDIAEDVKGPYASSPADIRATAENIAENYSFDPSILAGAICAALVSERERCAKVADDAAIPPRVRLRVSDDMLRELVRLAGKATPGPWDTDEPNIVYSMAGGGCVYLANTEGLDTSAQQCRADASFIEAADPPTVAALASELLKLREAVKPFAAIKAGEAVPVGLVERLREGPIRTGDTEDGEYELFDVEEAAQTMHEAADELTALKAKVALLTEALEWYGERARLARLIHSGGDPARFELSDDGGKRARAALTRSQP